VEALELGLRHVFLIEFNEGLTSDRLNQIVDLLVRTFLLLNAQTPRGAIKQ
jgi:hypothetical protein